MKLVNIIPNNVVLLFGENADIQHIINDYIEVRNSDMYHTGTPSKEVMLSSHISLC